MAIFHLFPAVRAALAGSALAPLRCNDVDRRHDIGEQRNTIGDLLAGGRHVEHSGFKPIVTAR